jgi:hypothetical protein
MRRVSLPANFTNSSQTIWVGTNGYVSVTVDPTTSPGTTWPTAGGAVVGPGVADLVQSSLDYKADSSNFYVYWKGYRLGDTSKELWYLMKFYWNSTTVDVYFERYTLTDGSLDAVRNGNSQYSTWANSTSITGMSVPTGMTSSTTNNGVDDNRTAITASKPVTQTAPTGGSVSVNPTTGTAGSTTYTASASGWSGSGTISYSYSWQYFSSSSFSWVQAATGSTFSPASNINTLYPNYGWQVVVTASNGVSPNGTASTSVTINSPASGTAPATPTNGGGTYSTGTNYVSNATFTSSASGTTPITYYWSVYSSTSSGGASTGYTNSGNIQSSSLSTTINIPQQSWNQATYGNWANYSVYAQNSVNTSGTLTWAL